MRSGYYQRCALPLALRKGSYAAMKSTALVTGANSGIGKTIVSRLARCGYDVAINYREDANFAEHLAEELQKHAIAPSAFTGTLAFPQMWTQCLKKFFRLSASSTRWSTMLGFRSGSRCSKFRRQTGT